MGGKARLGGRLHTLMTIASGLKQDFNHSAHVLGTLMIVCICRAEARSLKFMNQLWNFFQHVQLEARWLRQGIALENIGSKCIFVFFRFPVFMSLQNSMREMNLQRCEMEIIL